MNPSTRAGFFVLLVFLVGTPALAQSVYTQRPDDSHAVYLEHGQFGVHGDGVGDDADALQAAINKVQETTGVGVVFVPQGRYRLSHTVFLWQGIRVIGYGARRPVLVLAPNTPGFQTGHGYDGTGRYMVQFAERRPLAHEPFVDANEFTFYSAMSNLDFEIGAANPAAIAVRFHVAQHSFLAHMRFSVGEGRAALEDVGNQASDLEISGGTYGIVTERTAPRWQFLLMDSRLSGQRVAAIHTEEAGMTLVRVRIAHVPVAVEVQPGKPEALYGRDLLLEDVSRAGVVLGDVTNPHHEVTLEQVRCAHVRKLLEGGERAAGWTPIVARGPFFTEDKLTLGLEIDEHGREGAIALRHHETPLRAAPKPVPSDIPALPPMSDWVNAQSVGAVGDGGTDDTPALQAAIDAHRVLYLPSGIYRLRNTLRLRPDTVLIGFSPAATQLAIWDGEPAFTVGLPGEPVPLLQTPKGGTNLVTGVGINTGNVAPRAVGVLWESGPRSMLEDVNFPRGRGKLPEALAPKLLPPVAAAQGDNRNTQGPSLWVRDGGGGIFRDIWTPNTMARAGVRVENTQTPGVVYQLSCEHHMKVEVQMAHASHWTWYDLQTEEEKPDGEEAIALELEDVHDTVFANQFEYRVSRTLLPMEAGTVAMGANEVRWENLHSFSMTRLAFDSSVEDARSGVRVRAHDFTSFALSAATKLGAPLPLPTVFAPGARLGKLADGFSNASGLTTDAAGRLYFADSARHRIYRWNPEARRAEVVTEALEAPQTVVSASDAMLLAVDRSKTVYVVLKDGSAPPQPVMGEVTARPDTRLVLPVGVHEEMDWLRWLVDRQGFVFSGRSNLATAAVVADEPRRYFYAPGTSTGLIAGGPETPWRPLLQSAQLLPFRAVESHLAVSETDEEVYRVTLRSTGKLDVGALLPRGGTSVVEDATGNVYVAGAQVFVYGPNGRALGLLEVPERPSSLAIGGPAGRTLFVGARSGLYSIELGQPHP